jgi:hypothetical protein
MFKRPILRNEEGASPGGGAVEPVATPAEPQAQGGAPAAVVTMEALKSVLAEAMSSVRNGIHADLRKAGVYDTKPSKATAPAETAPTTAAAVAATQTVDVQQLLARESAFVRAVAPAGLSDDQYAMVDEMFRAVNPPDPRAWATGFLKTMGIGKANAPAQPAAIAQPVTPVTPAPAPIAAKNVSDGGPATAGDIRDVDSVVDTNPLSLTQHDIARHKAKHGEAKSRSMIQAAVNAALMGRKATRG